MLKNFISYILQNLCTRSILSSDRPGSARNRRVSAMERIFAQLEHKKNFVFLGEAGSGKSELAVNFARQLARRTQREVHFFDLDMTKPLFRSRDAAGELEQAGVTVHFQEQFMDAPTLVGGVSPTLRDPGALAVMDVGGGLHRRPVHRRLRLPAQPGGRGGLLSHQSLPPLV